MKIGYFCNSTNWGNKKSYNQILEDYSQFLHYIYIQEDWENENTYCPTCTVTDPNGDNFNFVESSSCGDNFDPNIYTNYNGNDFNNICVFPVGATLAPGEVFVFGNSSAGDEIIQAADTTYPYNGNGYLVGFNGDDVRALAKIKDSDTSFIDVIGDYDFEADSSYDDPGTCWRYKPKLVICNFCI